MSTTINTNWKNEVRAHFASADEVAYRSFKGVSKPSFTEVKVEVMNRRTIRAAYQPAVLAISKLYRD